MRVVAYRGSRIKKLLDIAIFPNMFFLRSHDRSLLASSFRKTTWTRHRDMGVTKDVAVRVFLNGQSLRGLIVIAQLGKCHVPINRQAVPSPHSKHPKAPVRLLHDFCADHYSTIAPC